MTNQSNTEQMREALRKIAFDAVGMREVVEIARAALTAPAAEVPVAIGDADQHEWASAVNIASWGIQGRIPVEARTILAVNTQLQSTRLRGGVPEGWKLVPIKSTPKVAMALYEGARNCFSPKVAEGLWQELLTAAPQAPADAVDAGVVRDYYPELLLSRAAVKELEAKVFDQEQALSVLRASVASYQRDMANPPAYLQEAVIKAAGLGAMAEQIAALNEQLQKQTKET